MTSLHRRDVLAQGAAAALAVSLTGGEASAQGIVTRPNISALALNHPILIAYRTAVAAMKALPASDPRNWNNQAQIHLNHCPHSNWFFLPWHRAYLLAFERICRQLSGMPTFALPYWDWTGHPQLPAAFATQTYQGQTNPLYDGTRSSQTVTIPSGVAGPTVMSTILAETTFEVFASKRPNGQNSTAPNWQRANGIKGPLESGPHDQVHVRINGDMGQFISPRDPIFWLHHCNIDRIWDQWNRGGHANTSDTLWKTFPFNGNFVTPSGNSTTPYNPKVSDVLNINTLGYRYVSPFVVVAGNAQFLPKSIDLSKIKPPPPRPPEGPNVMRLNSAFAVSVKLTPVQAQGMEKLKPSVATPRVLADTKPAAAPARVIAFIYDVEPPASGNADVRVFVNFPDAKADTSIQDRHYAGSFTFFGADHSDHKVQSFMIDLTATVARLHIAGEDIKDEIKLQFVPVPIPGVQAAEQIKPGAVDIAVF